MKLNKNGITEGIIRVGTQQPCTKLALANIVFPKWSDTGLMGLIFRQCVSTKEQPVGHIYEEAKFQTVLRVLGGKVLMSGRPDCYCWTFDKVEKAKNIRAIGINSAEGILSLCSVLSEISDEEEKKMVADMFASLNKDMLLVHTPAEQRSCIEVTQEMYDAGVTACVDNWMEPDENGEAEATMLQVGDFLIVEKNKDGSYGVYRVGRDEFLSTHTLQ